MDKNWTLEGTSRLNSTGGSGTFTVPKAVAETFLSEHGQDFAVFVEDNKVMFKPLIDVEG